jgi:hypothetical protein
MCSTTWPNLTAPTIIVLHTVLEPTPRQSRILRQLVESAERPVTMTETARQRLVRTTCTMPIPPAPGTASTLARSTCPPVSSGSLGHAKSTGPPRAPGPAQGRRDLDREDLTRPKTPKGDPRNRSGPLYG